MRETLFLAVCNALGIDYKEACKQNRYRENVLARQMYFTLAKAIYGNVYSLGAIGRMKYFEKPLHHSTVIYHLQKFKDEIDQPFMRDVKQIYERLLKEFKPN